MLPQRFVMLVKGQDLSSLEGDGGNFLENFRARQGVSSEERSKRRKSRVRTISNSSWETLVDAGQGVPILGLKAYSRSWTRGPSDRLIERYLVDHLGSADCSTVICRECSSHSNFACPEEYRGVKSTRTRWEAARHSEP